ncbi:hypothetical protein BDR22DRAFT_891578 [Usnea florida]
MADESLDIKEELCKYHRVIDSGKFAAPGPKSTASNPALFVAGIEKVGLSLSDRDAADPSRISYESPFGKGNETFVDLNDLGVIDGAPSVRAELYKRLLYELGALFEKHRDIGKGPDMFTTLVIALSSEHTESDVFVQLRDEKHILITLSRH